MTRPTPRFYRPPPDPHAGPRKRVQVQINFAEAFGREAHRGLLTRITEAEDFDLHTLGLTPAVSAADAMRTAEAFDGLIVQLYQLTTAYDDADWHNCPIVTLGDLETKFPRIGPDEDAIGRAAAAFLLERGYPHVGFVGNEAIGFSETRLNGFREHLAHNARTGGADVEKGGEGHAPPDVFVYDRPVYGGLTGYKHELKYLGDWLEALPRPTALFCITEPIAREVINVCEARRLRVPRDVAILTVSSDELACATTRPSISAVRSDAFRIGFEAGRIMGQLLRKQPPPDGPVLIPPAGVDERQSTDPVAAAGPDVVRAIRFIHDRVADQLEVDDVVEHCSVSRRVLERQFRDDLSSTIRTEIHHARIARARDLLETTDLDLVDVSIRSGFTHRTHFSRLFKKLTGTTPSRHRRESHRR